jgi:hypothetical protein
MCHGKIEFGRAGEGSFCSNPACHGRTWPELNLNMPATTAAAPAAAPVPAPVAAPVKAKSK